MPLFRAEAAQSLTPVFPLPTPRETVSRHFPPVDGTSGAKRTSGTGPFSLVSSATEKGAKAAR